MGHFDCRAAGGRDAAGKRLRRRRILQIREACPARRPQPPAPTAFDPAFQVAAVMSPEVAAALARAQDEQSQRQRRAPGAAGRRSEAAGHRRDAREDERIRELQRLEQDRLGLSGSNMQRQERRRAPVRHPQAGACRAGLVPNKSGARSADLSRARLEQARFEQQRAERGPG